MVSQVPGPSRNVQLSFFQNSLATQLHIALLIIRDRPVQIGSTDTLSLSLSLSVCLCPNSQLQDILSLPSLPPSLSLSLSPLSHYQSHLQLWDILCAFLQTHPVSFGLFYPGQFKASAPSPDLSLLLPDTLLMVFSCCTAKHVDLDAPALHELCKLLYCIQSSQ